MMNTRVHTAKKVTHMKMRSFVGRVQIAQVWAVFEDQILVWKS